MDPKSFKGCVMHVTLMAGLTWLTVIGTGLLIWSRWCSKP